MSNKASVLLVDDNPDNLLALTSILEGLAEEVVAVRSGREALRLVLSREFAVILLDVRMPDIDGFETAHLIRQRRSSEHTPIIFITAYAAEEVPMTGYALGAVDFITTPVRPEILRSKVAVFVDLFKKARQINRQAEALQVRAQQLHQLTQASLAINGALTPEEMLDVATRSSRELIAADEAVTLATPEPMAPRLRWAVSLPSGDRRRALDETAVFVSLLDPTTGPLRISTEDLTSEPRWAPFRQSLAPRAELRNRLCAPLTGRDGRNMGWICAAASGPRLFTAEDESLLTQLAQVTSIALENTMYSEAREANRLKDEFLTTLSHELRTPLTAIVGWVRLLKDTPGLNQRFTHGLDVIARNVAAQARLIEDLLDVSRIIAGKLQIDPGALQPAAMVEAVCETMLPTAQAREIGIRIEVDSSLRYDEQMAGDPDRLQQVVWNLLSNALKFTQKGGHVEVRLDRVEDLLRLRVTDDGQGISPAFIRYVFDRFRQADSGTTRAEGGLGIGLALVRHIVELHGGTVTASSDGVGRGSTFTVLLPIKPPTTPVSRPSTAQAGGFISEAALAGLHILVVDDALDAREVMAEILGRAGAAVKTAGSADEAYQMLLAEPFDLLVSDIGMPGGDGLSLIRRVRASEAGAIPAVAVTAYAREEDHLLALQAGFHAHLAKPVEPPDLVATAVVTVRGAQGRVDQTQPWTPRRVDPVVKIDTAPILRPVPEQEPAAESPTRRRILIVEDDQDSREALKELLELSGHTVGVAGRGSEGVEKAIRERPEVALVDIGLPDMDGHEVARRIRGGIDGPIYLIALTGYAGSKARASALEAGFDAHVAKPVSPERLEVLLQNSVPSA